MFMRLLPVALFLIAFTACDHSETETKTRIDTTVRTHTSMDLLSKETPTFDSALAAAVGADEYGMKQYVFAYLKEGPNRSQDSATVADLQKKHLENIMRMATEGKLVIAGPFMDDTEVKGIYIFNVATVEEAQALTETDPAIQAGRLTIELHPWYGSAALVLLNNLHKRVEKKSVAE